MIICFSNFNISPTFSLTIMKKPPRNSTHQGFPTTPTLHLDSPKKFSFYFIEFLMTKLLNIQWILYRNSKQYKATLMHTHMKRILCSIQFNSTQFEFHSMYLISIEEFESNSIKFELDSKSIQIACNVI
jgi:hypothetical protein